MIDQLLAIWGSILGALAAVVLTVRASIPFVSGDAIIESISINEKINSKLLSFAKRTKKVWGSGENQFEYDGLPGVFKRIVDEELGNKQEGIYCQIDDHETFWKKAGQFIDNAYYHVTGDKLNDHEIEDLEYDYFISINSRIFDNISGRSLTIPQEECRKFLDQFADLDFHRGLHQLYLERKNQEKRIKWLESTKKATGILSVCSLILIMMCVISSILVIHAQILWGYLFALISIILFVIFVILTFVLSKYKWLLNKTWKVVLSILLILFLLLELSYPLRSYYFEAYVLPRIEDNPLKAFKCDESNRALFLEIFTREWFNEILSEYTAWSGSTNSSSISVNATSDSTDGGTAKIK